MRNFKTNVFDDELEDKIPIFDEDAEQTYNFTDESENENLDFDDDEDFISDIDFSQFKGDLKSSLKKIKHKIGSKKSIRKQQHKKKRHTKPLSKTFNVEHHATIYGKHKQTKRIIVPNSRPVIVEGVSRFILSQTPEDESARNIGYYKGEKLKHFTFAFDNNTGVDFNFELFNPSMPLDYLYSTSLNLNDKITSAGGANVSYSDILYNMLANPTLIVNAKFVFWAPIGSDLKAQISQPLIFKNKNIEGEVKIAPQQLALNVDNMQFQSDIVYFDLMRSIQRPFIPDGMDVIQYKILAGYKCTFCFYFKQIDLKKLLFKEAAQSKELL